MHEGSDGVRGVRQWYWAWIGLKEVLLDHLSVDERLEVVKSGSVFHDCSIRRQNLGFDCLQAHFSRIDSSRDVIDGILS